MTSTVCVSIDGVLSRLSSAPLVQRQATPDARVFYDVLKSRYRVALLMTTTVAEYDRTKWWLDSQGYAGFDSLLPAAEDAVDDVDAAYRQVTALKASRVDVGMVVSTNALVVAMASYQGITGLLWAPARPALMRGDMRPRRVRAWEAVTDEIANQTAHNDEKESAL